MIEDGELLRRYVEEASQEAFTELVRRHIDTVHAIAMRRANGNSHLASDVTQKVFISLTRHAHELITHPAITGWLYTSTRNAVVDAVRSEVSRQRREQEAMFLNESQPTIPMKHETLIEALDQLKPRDREAVLLRFFQGYAFRDVGRALRLTEDAARMRVDRALTKLRGELERRGVTSTAGALAAALADNAGIAAPAALTLRVTEAALALGPASAFTLGGIHALLATSKTILGLTAAALLVMGTLSHSQGNQIEQLNSSLSRILVERTALAARLATDRTAAQQKAASATTLTPAPRDAVAEFRARLDAMPDKKIPEIELLSESDWQAMVRDQQGITDESQLLLAFRSVRDRARSRFALMSIEALKRFATLNGGLLPRTFPDLAPYFDEPVSPSILARYAMLRTGKYDDMPAATPLVGEITGVVDDFGDSVMRFGRTPESLVISGGNSITVRVLRAAYVYASSHEGVMPASADDLSASFTAGERTAVQTALDRIAGRGNRGRAATPRNAAP